MITNERAIEVLTALQEPEAWESQITQETYEALDKAIEAVNLQIPMKPIVMKSIFTGKTMDECPRCRTTVHIFGRCPCCGQAIDWSEYVF